MGVQNDNNVEGSKFEAAMGKYVGDTTKHLPSSEWEKMSAMARGENYVDTRTRISKDEHYLTIAEAMSLRGTCIRRRFGAIIVKNDEIISSGYVGAPRGRKNCIDLGYCWRESNNIPSGQMYEKCRSVHAEMNAIISARRADMIGSTMYLVGVENDGSYTEADCCSMCKRVIINAGIEKVVFRTKSGGIRTIDVQDWVNIDDSLTIHEGY